MAETPAPTAARSGTKTFAGQPWYVWAAGIGALALGYYLIKKQQAATAAAAAPAATTAPAASPAGTSASQYLLWLMDHQASPKKVTKTKQVTCPKGYYYDQDAKKCILEAARGSHK